MKSDEVGEKFIELFDYYTELLNINELTAKEAKIMLFRLFLLMRNLAYTHVINFWINIQAINRIQSFFNMSLNDEFRIEWGNNR
jgi:hypothetical protein